MKKILLFIFVFLSSFVVYGATYYVVPGGAGSKNGTSWANAFSDVQTAIDKAYEVATADNPSEVWIAKGSYKHGSQMTMKNNVAIYGGFAGTETSKDQRVAGNNTILDGECKYRVFYNNYTEDNPLTNSAKLDNVTIQSGYVSYNDGAGMYNNYASPEITNCTFSNNSAEWCGGGMYNGAYSSPVLINCTFTNNSASGDGGGMHNDYDSSPVLTNCTFSGNSADFGGGMYNYYSSPTLTNCTFSGNSATGDDYSNGGGMYNHDYSSPILTNCILWGNTASYRGNEIHNEFLNNKPTIDTCIIKGGYSSYYGTYTNIITADPKLMPLGNYGGSVQTCPVGVGSSAIGAGKVIEDLTTDARGVVRSSTPTIGACEYQDKLTVASISTTEGGLKYSSSYEFTLNVNVSDIDVTKVNLTYQWYKDGVAIAGATSSSYKTSQNVGTSKYTVVVSDGTTTITSSEITIETVDTPRYYVSTTGSSENDGLSWATAKSDVQEAIDLANQVYGGGEVWIAKGTYKHGSQMTMKNNVAIYGGFAGTETSKDQRVAGNNTILDGECKYRVFYNNYTEDNPLTNSAKLDNVTIQNGYYASGSGAGMYNNYASPEITNCTFSNNSAEWCGGGMYNGAYSSPVLINCTFTNNSASGDGGGMYNYYYSSPELTNCTLTGNSAYEGGGMYNNYYSSLTLTNCILWGNTASSSGDEIYNYNSNSKPTIDTCIIKGGYSSYGTYTNIITADPKLMPLGNYGGSVQTCPVGADSSAIGTGKVIEDLTTDARGVVRSSTLPTIGAYEYEIDDLPVISTQPEALDIFTNNDGSLSVSVIGEALRYQWYFNSEAINGATSATLSFKNIQAGKAGSYYCVITNPAGSVQTNAVQLNVKPAPSIETQPTAFVVWANVDKTLSVSATGEELSYQWYFNGKVIDGATSAILSFEKIQTNQAGSYYCVITNPAGSVTSEVVSVIVKPAPSITTQPTGFEVYSDVNGSLSVSATGEELSYQWYHNGKAIEGATDSTLSFENIQADKAGSYYCVITNPTDSVQSSIAEIIVRESASIVEQPQSVELFSGYSTTLKVSAKGYSVSYQWQKLVNDEWVNIANATSSTFEIESAMLSDTGKYRCVVSNGGATITSNTATLTVRESASIVEQPQSVELFSGYSTTLKVSTKGYSVSYQWQKLVDNEWVDIENATSSSYEIVSTKLSDNGEYRCIVSNGGATVISNTATLTVRETASIVEHPNSVELFNGYSTILRVMARGDEVKYQWQRLVNNEWLDVVGANSDKYYIEDLKLTNTGEYRCIVSNGGATVISKTATLTVRESASITIPPQNAQSYTGYYTTLSVSASGYDLKYQWQKYVNGKWIDIVGETSSTYNITNLNESDSGEYRCVVSNGGATVVSNPSKLVVLQTSKIKITQQPVPIPTAVDDDTELSVSASGGGIYYQWQVKNGKVWEDVSGATSSTLELKNLQAEDNNKEYRCILKNDISTATSKTAKLVVVSIPTYEPDAKKHVPEVAIIEGKKNKATFAIKATKPKGETGTYKYQWYKNGEPIAKATKATYTTDVLVDSDFERDPDDNIYYTKDTYYCVISVDVKKQIITSKKTENFKVMKLEPAKILKNPEDKVVSSGEDAIFTAEATKTSGVKAVYQWQVCAFGSDPENPKNWKNAGKGKTLTLKKATVKLSGNLYRCQVSNDLNKKDPDTSAYAKLEVKGTPIIKTQPKAITTYEGLDLELMALVSGYDLTYQWWVSADGKSNWETLSEDDFLLLLEDVESTFFYQFVAYNDENEVVFSKSAKVTVKAKVEVQYLEVLQNKLPVDVDNDSAKVVSIADVVLSVTARGDSPKYEWQVSDDGIYWTPIKGATKKTYTIKKTNLIIENGRMFRCRVYNGTGKIGTDSYIGTEDVSDAVMIIVK